MRRHLPHAAHPRLEALEGRDVPAGNVTASLLGGRLTITGDDRDNTLTLLVTPAAVTVTPDATTSVNRQAPGTPAVLPGPATSLAANLHGGADRLSIDPGSDFVLAGAAAVNLGDGDNTLTLSTGGRITLGSLAVTSGPGSNFVRLFTGGAGMGTVTGPALFSFGSGGANGINLTNTNFLGAAGVRVAVGSGGSINELTADNVTVARTLSVNVGRATGGGGSGTQGFHNATLGGLIVTGAGPNISLNSSTINGNLSAIGEFTAAVSTFAGLTVTHNVSVSGGQSGSFQATGTATINGNLSVTGGQDATALVGSSSFTPVETFAARNVSVSGGQRSIFHASSFSGTSFSATINGNLSVTSRQSPSVSFQTNALSEVRGNVAVRGGRLETSFYTDGNFRADRNVTVSGAPDSSLTSVTIGGRPTVPVVIRGNLTESSGNGHLFLGLVNVTVGGATRVTGGAAADFLGVNGTTFQGAFTANTGAGDDTFNIAQQTFMPAPVTFGGRAVINAGPGNDTLRLGVAGVPNLRADFSVPTSRLNGGTGFNTFFRSTAQFTGLTDADFVNWTNA
jgi:hypothetical protein